MAERLMSSTASGIDPRMLRRALGNFASGVTIVTACSADGRKAGVTANSFNSVSLDPPLILWSLDKRSSAWAVFRDASHFAVNLLAVDQVELSDHFARSQADKFAGIEHGTGLGGAALFEGCAGNFQCAAHQQIDAGDHWLLLGRVEKFEDLGRAPLVYHQGGYAMVMPHPSSKSAVPDMAGESTDLLDSPLGNNLFFLMLQAINGNHPRLLQENESLGLHKNESRLLMILDSAPHASVEDLRRAVSMPVHEVLEALATLQFKGYLEPDGGRQRVSVKGHAKVRHLWETLHRVERELFSELSDAELEVFKRGLRLSIVEH
jgi:flavin reductase (DIM6/NTAB) family NADH-FMN oxidoreductase RutF/DNA-binding MarR family transcriptional regulator